MNSTLANPTTAPSTDPLAQLRDIHLPEAISGWPPAPGWWLLLATLLLLILLAWLSYRHYQRGAIKRASLRELEQLAHRYPDQPQQLLQQLSQLLRRAALATQPQDGVAGLSGHAWLAFLDDFSDGKPFTQGIGQVLSQAPYQKNTADFEVEPLITLSRHCITHLFKRGSRHV
ncbi:MAG: DUF4381 domain-containing protein [Gammaproteobacteria bacterium]|nr:DUF4381 domain-containing protein [Gammaproteobacteria bacterium]